MIPFSIFGTSAARAGRVQGSGLSDSKEARSVADPKTKKKKRSKNNNSAANKLDLRKIIKHILIINNNILTRRVSCLRDESAALLVLKLKVGVCTHETLNKVIYIYEYAYLHTYVYYGERGVYKKKEKAEGKTCHVTTM